MSRSRQVRNVHVWSHCTHVQSFVFGKNPHWKFQLFWWKINLFFLFFKFA